MTHDSDHCGVGGVSRQGSSRRRATSPNIFSISTAVSLYIARRIHSAQRARWSTTAPLWARAACANGLVIARLPCAVRPFPRAPRSPRSPPSPTQSRRCWTLRKASSASNIAPVNLFVSVSTANPLTRILLVRHRAQTVRGYGKHENKAAQPPIAPPHPTSLSIFALRCLRGSSTNVLATLMFTPLLYTGARCDAATLRKLPNHTTHRYIAVLAPTFGGRKKLSTHYYC